LHTVNTQSISDSSYPYKSLSLSPSLQSKTFIFLTVTCNIPILWAAISQHIINSPVHCIGHTALLKTPCSHFW